MNHFLVAIFFSVLNKWKKGALFFAAIWNASSCNVCLESPNNMFSICRICVTRSSSISLERIFGLPKCLVLSLACLLLFSKRLTKSSGWVFCTYSRSCVYDSRHYLYGWGSAVTYFGAGLLFMKYLYMFVCVQTVARAGPLLIVASHLLFGFFSLFLVFFCS